MADSCDILIRHGMLYDGSGRPAVRGDVAIVGDRIAALGQDLKLDAKQTLDAGGLAVAPGFINMLSWAMEALLHDGRSQSDIRQGVTLEVLGEGRSFGPWNDAQKTAEREEQGAIQYDIEWTTLGEYLQHLEQRGVSCNVTSFVGATTLRIHALGHDNRPPTAAELQLMCKLAAAAMEEGAVGVSSALAYAPAAYATQDELTALARVVAKYDGLYTSHIRNEADNLLPAFDEFAAIARDSGCRAELYHIKAAGRDNWSKMSTLLERIEGARGNGLPITANMYPYHASSSDLDATMPPWVQEGGLKAWVQRLKDPDIRAQVKAAMSQPSKDWDNFYYSAGGAENIVLVGFKTDKLQPLAGRTVADVARERGTSPEDTIIDLVIEDHSSIGAAYFSMSEDNVREALRMPWISFCSDAQSVASEGLFLKRQPHPRTYGTFARVLGKYARDEQLITLPEAIRRLSALPAENLRLRDRGKLEKGYFADVVLFDPAKVQDKATFAHPHQYAEGIVHVLVNGAPVIRDGDHTGAKPGRFVHGPGYRGAS
jgi:N-acyl-D-amino-acid deacylase